MAVFYCSISHGYIIGMMAQRFFKLLYVLSLIGIGFGSIYVFLSEFDPSAIIRTSYRAKCLSNNEYVVLQGSEPNDAYVFDEFSLNRPFSSEWETRKDLNFYCKYYDQIRPHIIAYSESQTSGEQVTANQNFFESFKTIRPTVTAYPELYKLEVVSEVFQPYEIYSPILSGLFVAILWFLILQLIRMGYTYIVFNEIVWHPFRQRKK
jgi:hypothetical protein